MKNISTRQNNASAIYLFVILVFSVAAVLEEQISTANSSINFAVIRDYRIVKTESLKADTLANSWDPGYIISLGDNDYNHTRTNFEISLTKNVGTLYKDFVFLSRRAKMQLEFWIKPVLAIDRQP